MANAIITYPNDVTVTKHPDPRGFYRVRFTEPETGVRRDRRRRNPEAAHDLAKRLAHGQPDRPAEDTESLSHACVQELVEHFLEPSTHDRRPAYGTRKSHYYTARKWIFLIIGEIACADWTPTRTRAILRQAQAAGLAASTRKRILNTCGAIASIGARDGYLQHDPCAGIRVRAQQPAVAGQSGTYVERGSLPQNEHVQQLGRAMTNVHGSWWRRLQVLLSAYSGVRVSEMLALRGQSVDTARGTIDVREAVKADGDPQKLGLPKGDKVRTTIYPQFLDELIERRLEEVGDGLLFPRVDGDFERYQTFNLRYREAASTCGWHWRWHTLRHFFCVWALDELRLPVQDVSLFAGHHSPSFTYATYVSVSGDAVARARAATSRPA